MPFHAHIYHDHLAKQQQLITPLLNEGIHLTAGNSIPQSTQLLVTEYCAAEHLDQLPDLRWVILPCAGVPIPIRAILKDRPQIQVHNLHYNDISVAENALALLLAVSKRTLPLDQSLRQGHWTPSGIDTRHAILEGSSCLLLGYGAIGQKIAPILEAFGIRVSIMKRTAKQNLPYPCYTVDQWKDRLPQTDILISALPATTETHKIIDQAALDALPEHAVFINVGRADNVDEQALYQALKNKSIAAAGLDVWWNYPDTYPYIADENNPACFPSQYPYQTLDNVVMSPHRGADHRMEHLQQRLRNMLAERITRASQGLELPNRIDFQLGY